MRDGGGAVIVQLLVIVGADVAAGEDLFEVLEEGGVDRHHVFKVAMDRAVLHHQDLAVALDDLRLDLADLLIEENLMGELAIDDLLTDLRACTGGRANRSCVASQGAAFAIQKNLGANGEILH